MPQKVLCPACGTINLISLRPLQRCRTCKKRLPFTVPRTAVYVLRTLWRVFVIMVLVAIVAYFAPVLKDYQQNQKIIVNI